eukprot:TRINITY_DN6903_c0_g1_i2.p1 TRINITY_DN6903_c0_g1~~TRINITY_DN6903_c0_g1_i2.p1  ORF type:complete len:445 (-),score=82.59 TRINITY_DN6903_c0_g1_i2:41-1321(-)
MSEVAQEIKDSSSDEEEQYKKKPDDSPFPLKITYCQPCSLPPEYCEYLPTKQFKKCHDWLKTNVPDMYPELKNPPPAKPKKKPPPKGKFFKWPEIELFHHVRAGKSHNNEIIAYYGKIKLHGTNVAVSIQNGNKKDVFVQSRSKFLQRKQDHHGFASFIGRTSEYWKSLYDPRTCNSLTVFGEWCGKEIMKGAAICTLDKIILAVFAIQIDDQLIIEPDAIKEFLDKPKLPKEVFVIPYVTDKFDVDFGDESQLKNTIDKINELVEDIEKEDPWVKKQFGITGPGEGLVWYPVGKIVEGKIPISLYSRLVFKTKGAAHNVLKLNKSAQLDPDKAESANDFVEMVTTSQRLEQGVSEGVNGEYTEGRIGDFISWVWSDIKKECESELLASSLSWDQVEQAIKLKARKWFIQKLMEKGIVVSADKEKN